MAGSPPDRSKVDAIYDLLADLPTVDDALVGMLNEPAPSLGDASPLALMGLAPFSFPPHPPPSAFTKELKALWDSLNLRLDALQSTIEGLKAPLSPLPLCLPLPPLPLLRSLVPRNTMPSLPPLPQLRLHLPQHPLPPLLHAPHPLSPPHSPPW
ncbi:hypothetical protein EDB85DRAFT_2154571 [Lactarius pseudohatsudake]|nr:hypothetical protein EDB85DRAFT_2154571 [Lactarius pseudohatsudake]